MKKLSVITPVWNRCDLTDKFLRQNWVALEHRTDVKWVIVDNGSDDMTPKLLQRWKGIIGDRLKIITLPENIGFGPANNLGADLAIGDVSKGDVLAFISNDVQVLGDYWTPIKEQLKAAISLPPALWGAEMFTKDTGWNTFKETGTISYVTGWCVIVESACWGTLCKWDERFVPCDFEDIDLSYQMTSRDHSLRQIDLPLKHGGTGNSGQNLEGGRLKTTLANRKRFLDKWGLTKV